MQRRSVVLGITGAIVSGGLALDLDPGSQIDPDLDWKFTSYDPSSDFYDSAPDVTDSAEVSFNNGTTIEIVGMLFVGSSKCGKAVLKRATYDENSGKLQVTVGSEQKGRTCPADESADAYRAVFMFDEQLPDTVTVKETDGGEPITVQNPNGTT
jgi:hypothetical protein